MTNGGIEVEINRKVSKLIKETCECACQAPSSELEFESIGEEERETEREREREREKGIPKRSPTTFDRWIDRPIVKCTRESVQSRWSRSEGDRSGCRNENRPATRTLVETQSGNVPETFVNEALGRDPRCLRNACVTYLDVDKRPVNAASLSGAFIR